MTIGLIRFTRVRAAALPRRLLSTAAPTPSPTPAGGRRDAAGIAVFSSICLGAAGLGVWQMQRYQWKMSVIEEIERKMHAPPEAMPSKLAQYELAEYVEQIRGRAMKVTGTFDHAAEVLVGPRSAPAGLVGTAAQGLAINPQGYYVLTPLVRSDGTVVFVNRGWVAKSETNWVRPTGQVTLFAIVSRGETPGTFSPPNVPATKRLFWLELEALRTAANRPQLGAKEVVVVEAFEPDDVPVTSYPAARRLKHLTEQHVTPLMHLVYAGTWFSLSIAGFFMTFSKFRRPALARRMRVPPSVSGGKSGGGGGSSSSSSG